MLQVRPITARVAACFAVVLCLLLAAEARAIVSYEVPTGTVGNQNFGGALGMDFVVNQAITIDKLGVFDSGSDGLSVPLTAYIYDRSSGGTAAPLATLVFPAGSGTLINGSRFLNLPVSLNLPAGFQGTIVASGYGPAELLGNQGAAPLGLTTNSGGGAISFVGSSRFGVTPSLFPATPDGGPANRYAAGTFNFSPSTAIPVALQNGTAILSQPNFSVDQAIDGNLTPSVQFNGWANSALGDNIAAFETVSDLTNDRGFKLTFNLTSGGFGALTLGRFRLSVTGDDRSTFADGLDNGGDVTANWVPLDIDAIMSSNPATSFTELGDLSILASGPSAEVETYVLSAVTTLGNITGIRVELIEDASLPAAGPGRSGNGNFVLLEMSVTAQAILLPEPGTALLLVMASAGLAARRRRAA